MSIADGMVLRLVGTEGRKNLRLGCLEILPGTIEIKLLSCGQKLPTVSIRLKRIQKFLKCSARHRADSLSQKCCDTRVMDLRIADERETSPFYVFLFFQRQIKTEI